MILRSSSTRSSLICVSIGISPTSSRNSVPPLAYSNLPIRLRRRAGERPCFVAEQLAFENAFRQGGDVERHERLAFARAVLMHGPGDEFLAGAVLALDQHGAVGRGDVVELCR